jgi:hypothetical protein
MITSTSKLAALLTVCLTTVVLTPGQDDPSKVAARRGISIDEVRDYRKMFRVNEKPIDMVEETKVMCAPPVLVHGPHYDPGAVYYINAVALRGMKTYSEQRLFPIGSIIVKEKQERKTEDSVQIITVMKKVLPGNGEDSWEYKMYDAKKWTEIDFSNQAVNPSNKTCIECHRRYKDNDYVSDKGIALLLRR